MPWVEREREKEGEGGRRWGLEREDSGKGGEQKGERKKGFKVEVESKTYIIWLEFNSLVTCWLKHSPQMRYFSFGQTAVLNPCRWLLGSGVFWILLEDKILLKNPNQAKTKLVFLL